LQPGAKSNPPVNGGPGSTSTSSTSSTAPFGNAVASMVSGAMHAVSGHTGTTHGIMDAVCGICEKTKFADGLGHVCTHCRRKTCTRCGYQLNTDVDQVQWTCKPCAQRTDGANSAPQSGHPLSSFTGTNVRPTVPMTSAPTGTSATGASTNPLDPKAAGRLVSGFLGMFSASPQQQQQQRQTSAAGDPNRSGTETKRILPRIGPEVSSPVSSRYPTAYTPGSGRMLPKPNALNRSTSLDPEQNNSSYPVDPRSPRGYLSRQHTDSDPMDDRYRGNYRRSEWHEADSRHAYSPYHEPRQDNYPASRSDEPYGHTGIRGHQHPRHPHSTPSRLDPNYGTDSLTSDQSESPGGRSGSVSGWSAAGAQYRPTTGTRYSHPSDAEYVHESYPQSPSKYMTPKGSHLHPSRGTGEPLDRTRGAYLFSPVPPDPVDRTGTVRDTPYRSFSSSEGEEFGMTGGDEALVYPAGLDIPPPSGGRPRRALPSHVPDLTHTPNRPSALGDDLSDMPRLSYASLRSTGNTYSRSDIVYGPRKGYASSSVDMPMSPRSGRLAVDYQSVGRQRGEDPFYRMRSDANSLLSIPGQAPMTHPVTWNPSRDGKRLIGHMILRRQTDRGPGDVGSLLGKS
uniref:FYVE-type domain-containing protein n=1 Tax=Echinostoma caproni TaxID=27848 RepID=A0A183AZX0_9TREM